MSYSGRVNVDALIHDKVGSSFKIVDVESSRNVASKTALISGTATEGGATINPAATGVRDSSGTEISFSSVDIIILKSVNACVCTASSAGVVLKNEANQCVVSATPSNGANSMSVSGSGAFELVLVGS